MNIVKELNMRLEQLMMDKRQVEKMLKHAPKQRVTAVCCNGSYQFYLGHKYMRKKDKKSFSEITKMVEGEYNSLVLEEINRQIDLVSELIYSIEEDSLGEVYRNLNEGKKQVISPLHMEREAYMNMWMSMEYDHWDIEECNGTEYYSIKKERVRSKSEKIIADELYRYKIPYRYEYPLELMDEGMIVNRRPDFVALNRTTLKLIVIEHLGRMSDDDYEEKNFNKIDLYERNGYMLGDNLILLHETRERPLNIKILDKYIEMYLL